MSKTKNINESRRKYRHTFNGLISDMHDGMRRRCIRGNCRTPKLYIGKFVPESKSFREIALNSVILQSLHKDWEMSGFKLYLKPTPDRINTNLGYELYNIRFKSLSDNVKLGHLNRKRKNEA